VVIVVSEPTHSPPPSPIRARANIVVHRGERSKKNVDGACVPTGVSMSNGRDSSAIDLMSSSCIDVPSKVFAESVV
jgi:hypothetical protein